MNDAPLSSEIKKIDLKHFVMGTWPLEEIYDMVKTFNALPPDSKERMSTMTNLMSAHLIQYFLHEDIKTIISERAEHLDLCRKQFNTARRKEAKGEIKPPKYFRKYRSNSGPLAELHHDKGEIILTGRNLLRITGKKKLHIQVRHIKELEIDDVDFACGISDYVNVLIIT